MSKRKNPRKEPTSSRYFTAILYLDDERFPSQLEVLNSSYRWVGIVHDRDFDENDNLKKSHMHIVARLPSGNSTTKKSFVDRVNLEYRKVHKDGSVTSSVHAQCCINYRGALRYLVHADDLDKQPYDENDLQGHPEMISDAIKAIQNRDLNTTTIELLDRLDDIPVALSYSDFLRVMCGYGLASAVRSVKVNILLEEHNKKVLNGYYQSKIKGEK